jgi:hypothetical protein
MGNARASGIPPEFVDLRRPSANHAHSLVIAYAISQPQGSDLAVAFPFRR